MGYMRCCHICNQGRLLLYLAFHHLRRQRGLPFLPYLPSLPALLLPPLPPLPFAMLPSSQVNTNPFEIISRDPSRSTTPVPSPSPNGSSPALSHENPTPPSAETPPSPPASQSADQPSSAPSRATSHSFSSTFISSPLNPHSTAPYPFARPRPLSGSRIFTPLPRLASQSSHPHHP